MKKERIIKIKIQEDYPLVKRRVKSEPTLDEIGEYAHTILSKNMIYYGRQSRETRRDVRGIVEYKFGKKITDKYTDEALEDAWYQYEPQ